MRGNLFCPATSTSISSCGDSTSRGSGRAVFRPRVFRSVIATFARRTRPADARQLILPSHFYQHFFLWRFHFARQWQGGLQTARVPICNCHVCAAYTTSGCAATYFAQPLLPAFLPVEIPLRAAVAGRSSARDCSDL